MIKPDGFDKRKAHAESLLVEWLRKSKRAVVLSSFGKDSLCVLALLDGLKQQTEVAYFELGALPHAHRFARHFIANSNLPLTLLRPHKTLIVAGGGGADVAYEFRLESGDAFQIASIP